MADTDDAPPAFEAWAILELMGHRQRAGLVREVTLFGVTMARVDIPTADGGTVTEHYSGSAIYSMRPVTERVAREFAAQTIDPRPVMPADFRERQAPPGLRALPEPDEDGELPF